MNPTIDAIRTGDNIRALRKKAGLTVSTLQNRLGFTSPNAIYKWQSGQTLPTLDNLVILADALHVSINDIIILN